MPEDAKLVQILAAGDQSDEEPLQKLPALLKQIGDASAKNKGQQNFIGIFLFIDWKGKIISFVILSVKFLE